MVKFSLLTSNMFLNWDHLQDLNVLSLVKGLGMYSFEEEKTPGLRSVHVGAIALPCWVRKLGFPYRCLYNEMKVKILLAPELHVSLGLESCPYFHAYILYLSTPPLNKENDRLRGELAVFSWRILSECMPENHGTL